MADIAPIGSILFAIHLLVILSFVPNSTALLQKFLQEPEDVVLFAGDSAILRCRINWEVFSQSSHPVIVAWKKNDALLVNTSSSSSSTFHSSNSSVRVMTSGNSTQGEYDLLFQSLVEQDSGSYVCEIYYFVVVPLPDGLGVHNETVFVGDTSPSKLTVLPDVVPVCSFEPQHQVYGESPIFWEGTAVSFMCAAHELDTFQLKWKIDGYTIDDNSTHGLLKFNESGVTTLIYNTTVSVLNTGQILTCELHSLVYPHLRKSCQISPLDILFKPRVSIVKVSNASDVHTGDDVRFRCNIDANPSTVTIQWIVSPWQFHHVMGREIVVHNISSPDGFVTLTCVVSNNVGESSAHTTVQVNNLYKPVVSLTLQTTSPNIRPGEDIRFRCNIDANPPQVTVLWNVTPPHSVSLHEMDRDIIIRDITPTAIFVEVTCHVSNDVGVSTAHASIYLPPAAQNQTDALRTMSPSLLTQSLSIEMSTTKTETAPSNSNIIPSREDGTSDDTSLDHELSIQNHTDFLVASLKTDISLDFLTTLSLETTREDVEVTTHTTNLQQSIVTINFPNSKAGGWVIFNSNYLILIGLGTVFVLIIVLIGLIYFILRSKYKKTARNDQPQILYGHADDSLVVTMPQSHVHVEENP